MRAAFYTLGCKVNQYETEALMQQFAAAGFDIVEPDNDAEIYVVNSCTVTATGDKKSRQALRRFRRQNPSAITCLTGCFPQAFPDIAEAIPEADIITGSRNRAGLLEAVRQRMAGSGRVIDIIPHEKGETFEEMRLSGSHRTRAFVKIEDGCDRYCSYCIIPKARGPVRSKPPEALRSELEELVAAGYREAVLVGINLSSYGRDFGGRLLDAVRVACGVEGLARVRLGSLEPELLTSEDIAAMSQLPTLCPQFHLSLQSGCDATLQRMKRHYTTRDYRHIVESLRNAFPGCAITTDIMVGFPGETEEEFVQSLAFAEEISFAKAHVFAYSLRPGTKAASLPEQVPGEVKALRAKRMAETTNRTRAAFLTQQIGRTETVLAEQQVSPGRWEGYAANYTPVFFDCGEDVSGKLCDVIITKTDTKSDGCLGEFVKALW